ncbi:MAG: ribosomal-protein-alanine N-acetyltransferase [Candidatus Schekmanbacteria bacterium]|nr:MAG: ribosomal-protein-alanine N-acetyltransferase [Candidatus Schekmanbacteria bacterium]
MKIVISKMSIQDVPFVVEIENKCFSRPWTEEMFLFELKRSRVSKMYCARLDPKKNILCGYVCFWLFPGEAQITNIAVDPLYRRKGIGRKLLKHAIKRISQKNINEIFLEVRVSNAPALCLYESEGFVKIGRRKRYYSDTGEDAFLMKKTL